VWGDKIKKKTTYPTILQSTRAMRLPGNSFLCLMIITHSCSAFSASLAETLVDTQNPNRYPPVVAQDLWYVARLYLSADSSSAFAPFWIWQKAVLSWYVTWLRVSLTSQFPLLQCGIISRWKEPQTITPHSALIRATQIWILYQEGKLSFCHGWPTKLGKLDKFLRNEERAWSDLFNTQFWDLSRSCSHWIFTAFTHQVGHAASLFSVFVVCLRCCHYPLIVSVSVFSMHKEYCLHFHVGVRCKRKRNLHVLQSLITSALLFHFHRDKMHFLLRR